MSVLRSIRFPDGLFEWATQAAKTGGLSFNQLVIDGVGELRRIASGDSLGHHGPKDRNRALPTHPMEELHAEVISNGFTVRPSLQLGPSRPKPGAMLIEKKRKAK